jgi:hypothetical protein
MQKNTKRFNTWSMVRRLRQKIKTKLKDSSLVGNELDQSWKLIDSQRVEHLRDNRLYEGFENSNTPVHSFCALVKSGMLPPPEIMQSVALAFRFYFESKGEVSLEDAFFGKSVQGIGNRSALDSRHSIYRQIDMLINLHQENIYEVKMSTLQIVEHISKFHGIETDSESILRSYRRYKKNTDN